MALSTADREAFLAEPHIAALAVEAGPDRAPLTVPIWYDYQPGGELWLLTGTESRKMQLLRDAGRCTLLVERTEPSLRYVAVSGSIERTEEGSEAHVRHLAQRYLPAEVVDVYVRGAMADHGAQTRVVLRPEHWVSADLGSI